MRLLSIWYRKFQAAFAAMKNIFGIRPVHRAERRSCFVVDPTTGTLVVRPECHAKIEAVLMRAARQIAFRSLLHYRRLQIEHFALQARYALLRAIRYLSGKFFKAFGYARHEFPPGPSADS